ncbi:MAG: S8 family peptidase [Anaerolineales bacterium]|nr:S8 family peptidase [Anaerolineales bacterium]
MAKNKKLIIIRQITLVIIFGLMLSLTAPAGSLVFNGSQAQYIIRGSDLDHVVSLVEKYGGSVTSRLEIINGVGATLPQGAISLLKSENGILSVSENSLVEITGKKPGDDQGRKNWKSSPATDYADVTGSDMVWQEGNAGSGVTVAVVDTGIGWIKGLFKGINGRMNNRIIAWKDFVDRSRIPFDPNGHGSHVAGIIANTDIGEDHEWNGTAPGVKLVGVRVLNRQGYGTYEQVIKGIDWVVKNKDKYNIRVMNLSLVSTATTPYYADPLNQAVTAAWANGIVVVVAAGNNGSSPMTIGVPGNNPYAITVGAFTDNYTPLDWNDDYITPFSAAGPTLDGFAKPDLVAPGAHMVSTMLPSTYVSRNHQANWVSSTYFSMAGTSQAAAVVSGVSALIFSQHPELTPNEVKYRLMYTALPWVDMTSTDALYSIWQQGAGRVNAPDAVSADISGEANLGMDINADLAGLVHYEGFSYYDETTGKYRLRGDFNDWDGRYWAWDGGFGAWSGGFGAWSGGFGAWSGGFGAWSGGFGAWSGGFGAWSGSEPWAETELANTDFVENFMSGQLVNARTTSTAVGIWVEE